MPIHQTMINHINSLISFTQFFQELVNSGETDFAIYLDNERSCASISAEIEILDNIVKFKDIIFQYESRSTHEVSRSNDFDFAVFDINTGKMIQDCYLDDKYSDGADGNLSMFLPMIFYDLDVNV
jgi:ABC-type bacteriocin/lantibiotic exporter with double-glycine peptidase domain